MGGLMGGLMGGQMGGLMGGRMGRGRRAGLVGGLVGGTPNGAARLPPAFGQLGLGRLFEQKQPLHLAPPLRLDFLEIGARPLLEAARLAAAFHAPARRQLLLELADLLLKQSDLLRAALGAAALLE